MQILPIIYIYIYIYIIHQALPLVAHAEREGVDEDDEGHLRERDRMEREIGGGRRKRGGGVSSVAGSLLKYPNDAMIEKSAFSLSIEICMKGHGRSRHFLLISELGTLQVRARNRPILNPLAPLVASHIYIYIYIYIVFFCGAFFGISFSCMM
jgi:hypothetical protein